MVVFWLTNFKKNGTIEKSSIGGRPFIQAHGKLTDQRDGPKTKGMVTILPWARTNYRGDTTMFEDKTLVCKDCGKEFVWTAGEQEFYASRGFENQPQRCKPCRDARKNGGARSNSGERQMFDAVCAACGKACKVPFQPREDRPVYCSDCFARMKQN